MVKNLPEMLQTQVQSLGWEDPLEKGMATYSSILAQRIPWTEEAGTFPGYLSPLIKLGFASVQDGICTVGMRTGMAVCSSRRAGKDQEAGRLESPGAAKQTRSSFLIPFLSY